MKINFAKSIIDQSQKYLDKVAYYDANNQLTYGSLCEKTLRFGGGFKNSGVQPGDHVAIIMKDCLDWPPIFLSLIYIGAVPLMLSTRIPTELFVKIIDLAKIKLVVADDNNTQCNALNNVPTLQRTQVQKFLSYNTHIDPVYVEADAPGYMGLSSGTTGLPKIVVHRHQTFFEMSKTMPVSYNMGFDTVLLAAPKLSWGFGMQTSVTSVLACGATGILMSETPGPGIIFKYVDKYQPTLIVASPTIFKKILTSPKKYHLSESVKTVMSSSEDLPKWVYDHFFEKYGIRIDTSIGMSETANLNYAGTIYDHAPGTVGKPFPGVEVEIRDIHGNQCGTNEPGEIYIKSQCNAFYYYNNYQKTKETFVGEWVKSGDCAYLDENKNIVFVGRTDEIFKIQDQLISPVQVESVLENNNWVKEVAIVGIDNDQNNKEIHAFVVPLVDFDSTQFLKFAKDQLLSHQVPKHVHCLKQLPKTITFKKNRTALVEYVTTLQ